MAKTGQILRRGNKYRHKKKTIRTLANKIKKLSCLFCRDKKHMCRGTMKNTKLLWEKNADTIIKPLIKKVFMGVS